jgi:hypothetical protein
MPDLNAVARMTAGDYKILAIYWCKRDDGRIVEHVATAYEGHNGHVQCIAVAIADPPKYGRSAGA